MWSWTSGWNGEKKRGMSGDREWPGSAFARAREVVAVRVPREAVGVVARVVLGVAERVGARGF